MICCSAWGLATIGSTAPLRPAILSEQQSKMVHTHGFGPKFSQWQIIIIALVSIGACAIRHSKYDNTWKMCFNTGSIHNMYYMQLAHLGAPWSICCSRGGRVPSRTRLITSSELFPNSLRHSWSYNPTSETLIIKFTVLHRCAAVQLCSVHNATSWCRSCSCWPDCAGHSLNWNRCFQIS